ncbi:fumarylacetoacetate hydrolase family protein (plasmid) [Gemmobacter fulvus]|uniref:Fumarylacetoacetate hydrolase family protein n=1 Tax=Gemmobacter fulvus TaxID=2840474 RepID=A0A975PAJ0_9RHOB|nr:fumarylacetoacetate hydrolase family protein [Gemmobacter fulvus]MBT9246215.1 fumarylacetoacetate hydrolase family protein [Gemmobacter fulvus]QWK92427.1 fumarylacetoacetate hydrolase family protein [Gemmobacter fulvus]
MKLLRYGPAGAERPGLLDADGILRDLSGVVPDIGGDTLSDAGLARLRELDPAQLPAVPGQPRIGPCVAGVGKFICIGLNYADHAAETGKSVPPEPVIFLKATSAICGPNDPMEIPQGAVKADWEVELGIVIGARAKNIPQAQALDHVAGYCTINDGSERAFQSDMQGQWTKGKSHDSFGPIGPWLVTRDAVPDPQSLDLWCEVDGIRHQAGNTRTMVYGVAYLVAYLSRFMTLHPGDIIATGTPPGVGLGLKPPVFLRAGQRIRLEVQGLGMQDHLTVDVQP